MTLRVNEPSTRFLTSGGELLGGSIMTLRRSVKAYGYLNELSGRSVSRSVKAYGYRYGFLRFKDLFCPYTKNKSRPVRSGYETQALLPRTADKSSNEGCF
jgi:hypothetical protein